MPTRRRGYLSIAACATFCLGKGGAGGGESALSGGKEDYPTVFSRLCDCSGERQEQFSPCLAPPALLEAILPRNRKGELVGRDPFEQGAALRLSLSPRPVVLGWGICRCCSLPSPPGALWAGKGACCLRGGLRAFAPGARRRSTPFWGRVCGDFPSGSTGRLGERSLSGGGIWRTKREDRSAVSRPYPR